MKADKKIEEAIKDFKQGKFLIITDHEKRENEGDLIVAAEKITPEKVNFMAKYARGLICVPMKKERLDELNIYPMLENQEELYNCKFTVSVDVKKGTTTGISAYDRAATIKALVDPKAKASDFKQPGHMFPLIAEKDGVLRRAGHTEAGIDLAKLSGLYPAAVICEIMSDDGNMAKIPELLGFGKKHDIKVISIDDLRKHIFSITDIAQLSSEAKLPTKYGQFKIQIYVNKITDEETAVLIKGDLEKNDDVLVRLHSECLTGDTFASERCDCGPQLHKAMEMIEKEGSGIIVYLRQEGRGIGLCNKIKAYSLQDNGRDTVEANIELGFEADSRNYSFAAKILEKLGVKSIKLMTNNPEKIKGVENCGIKVNERVLINPGTNVHNVDYLQTKKEKMGHMI